MKRPNSRYAAALSRVRLRGTQEKEEDYGYVYIVGNHFHHWYKIGVSRGIQGRLAEMQVGCPVVLICFESAWVKEPYKIEKELHSKYSSRHLRGEWFLLQDEEVAEIQSYLSVTDKKRAISENPTTENGRRSTD